MLVVYDVRDSASLEATGDAMFSPAALQKVKGVRDGKVLLCAPFRQDNRQRMQHVSVSCGRKLIAF